MSAADDHEPEPLRADARRMLATWREADAMPRAAKGRVWKRMRGKSVARTPKPRYDVAVWAVAIAAAVLLVWWGVATVRRAALDDAARPVDQAVDHRDAPPIERDVVEPAPAVDPPVVALPAEPVPTIAAPVQKPADAVRPSTRPRVDPSRADEPPPVDTATTTLARERDLIARAWSALADADYGAALHRAAEHAQAFPDGLLAPERRAIEVIARCKRGDGGADVAAQAWIDAQPRSPLASRVRVACE